MANRSKGKESAKSAREKAAAARAAQQAAEKRRERLVRIIGAAVVVVVVGGIIGIAIAVSRSGGDSGGGGGTVNPAAPRPKGVFGPDDPNAYGVPVTKDPAATIPTLAIWEDFQCPACGQVEATNGTGIQGLAEKGEANLIWRPTAFLDGRYKGFNSARATAAWGCAIDQDKTVPYHNLVFANQPKDEGVGWTDDQLLQFGKDSGIEGDAYTTFESCVKAGTYLDWSANSTAAFQASGAGGTPTAYINGVEVPESFTVLSDMAKLREALKNPPSPSPSPSASAS